MKKFTSIIVGVASLLVPAFALAGDIPDPNLLTSKEAQSVCTWDLPKKEQVTTRGGDNVIKTVARAQCVVLESDDIVYLWYSTHSSGAPPMSQVVAAKWAAYYKPEIDSNISEYVLRRGSSKIGNAYSVDIDSQTHFFDQSGDLQSAIYTSIRRWFSVGVSHEFTCMTTSVSSQAFCRRVTASLVSRYK